jgi:hypothetical protein
MSFNECSVLIELNPELSKQKNFFEFVYNKISKDQKNRYVMRGQDYIDILPFNSSGVRVIPSFKEVNIKELEKLNFEVFQASETILGQNEISQVYIVCPKNEKFMKHIELKIPNLEEECKDEYKIKIIPYSLNSIIRRKVQEKVCCSGGCYATV